MSKKSKKKPQATTAVAAAVNAIAVEPDSFPEPQFRLADMQASAPAHVDNKAWAEILALGRVPLTAIHEDDRKEAEVWQLRAKIFGLYPPGVQSIHWPEQPVSPPQAGAAPLSSCPAVKPAKLRHPVANAVPRQCVDRAHGGLAECGDRWRQHQFL